MISSGDCQIGDKLPTILVSNNMTESFAGNMALLFQLIAVPLTLFIVLIVFLAFCGSFSGVNRIIHS